MKCSLSLLLLFFSASTLAHIDPDIELPGERKLPAPIAREVSNSTPAEVVSAASEECNVKFIDLMYGGVEEKLYFKEKAPIEIWICVDAGEAMENGYESIGSGEQVFYDYTNKTWHVRKNSNLTPLASNDARKAQSPIKLYSIISKNARGYAVLDDNQVSGDSFGPRKLHFCMIHNYQALCGDGGMIRSENDKEIDLTPYALKLIESMEFIE